MRFWRFVAFALCVPLSLLIVFSGGSIKASAALSGGRYMTATEARQVFGDTISFQYWNGSDYVSGSFAYDSSIQLLGCDGVTKTDYILAQPIALKYVATVSTVNTSNNYVTVDIRPSYSIFDTSQLHSLIALSRGGAQVANSYTSPSWDWVWGGSSVHLENNVLNSSNFKAQVYFADWNYCTYVPADFSTQSLTSGYSVRAAFSGNSPTSNKYYLYIGVPYVDTDSTGSNGTYTTASGGSGGGSTEINVNVDVDMTETNGLLGDIADLLSGLVSGIQGLFVPSEQWLDDWLDAMADALEDAFGDIPALHDQLETAIQNLINNSAVQTLHFDGVSPPGVGQVIAPRDVPLKPAGFESLYSFVRIAVNLVATIAVINMLLNKFKAVLVGEVVISDGD